MAAATAPCTRTSLQAFTGITGYSFLVFNLLCAPCFAAIGAIKREMNNHKWTWFAIGYQCGFAYLVGLMINQFGNAFTGSLNIIGLHRRSGCAGHDRLYAGPPLQGGHQAQRQGVSTLSQPFPWIRRAPASATPPSGDGTRAAPSTPCLKMLQAS